MTEEQQEADENLTNILARQRNKDIPESIMEAVSNE